jgi:hypothetical protein
MVDKMGYSLMLRFRDLVTEPGGNIAEHRRIIKQYGYAWWGWWARRHEAVPSAAFDQLLPRGNGPAEVILFDTGMMRLYRTRATGVVVAPSHLGVTSPDFEATPEYYVRGRYPAWFRLEDDIVALNGVLPKVVARPTAAANCPPLDSNLIGQELELEVLRDERPTLWVIASIAPP